MKLLVLLFAICSFSFFQASGQENKIAFEHLTIQDGLSQNNVLCMIQDSKGYLWFGTYGGLNRYDGYSFKVYKFDPSDTTSLSQNLIMSLHEDQEGMIWVGTAGTGMCKFNPKTEKFTRYLEQPHLPDGLHHRTVCAISEDKEGLLWIGTVEGISRFDKKTEKFARFKSNASDPTSISTNYTITDLYKDKEGTLWIGTERNGLNKLIIASDKSGKSSKISFVRYQHDVANANSLSSNQVTAICEDRQGMLWVGTAHGLNQLNKKTGQWKHYWHNPKDPNSLSSSQINMDALLEDSLGNLWVGTTNGLNKLNRERTKFTSYKHDPDDENSLSSSDIRSLLIDRSGILWIGTIGGGINKIDSNKRQFTLLRHDPHDANAISNSAVRAIFEDKEGIIWIGTEGGGLNRYDRATGRIINYKHDPNDPNSVSSNLISAILEDRTGNLWVGSSSSSYDFNSGAGMNKLDKANGKFIHYLNNADDFISIDVHTLYEDKQGVLWIGTENGIISFDQANGKMVHYPHDSDNPDGINDYWIYAIYEDSRGNLWIGTGSGGLNKLDRQTGKFAHYKYDPHNPKSISSNAIRTIYEDKKGNLWIGTSFGGLCKFDPVAESFITYTENEGLPDNAVYGILEDEEGNLWLSTNKGICRFSPNKLTFTNFDYSDGLQSNQFASGYVNTGASFKGKDGTLYFGGSDGMNMFHPKDIHFNSYTPPVVITQFKLFDKVLPGKHETREIVLSYGENFFSFEFAALNFTNSHKNQYAYKLENFDKEWIYSGTRRYASYTNLDPGEYIFRVKGSNNDGVWNEQGASIRLMILPPWWQTWWAYSLYGMLFIGFLYGLRQHTVKRERLKHELQLQRLEAEKMHEIDHVKSRFFANISHEFRTPLTLILGPLEKLLTQPVYGKDHSLFSMMQRNAQRLLHLINQLLDLSKLEAGSLKLEAKPGNIIGFLRAIVSSFTSLAQTRNIDFSVDFPSSMLIAPFDADKLEKIVTNLLSNAFKFTPDGGAVKVKVSIQNAVERFSSGKGPQLAITIEDSGIGIAEEQIEKVFDRFYQVGGSHTCLTEGTGIGLALTKELIELHGGTISVSSIEGKGSNFIVHLPLVVIPQYKYTETWLANECTSIKTGPLTGVENAETGQKQLAEKNNMPEQLPLLLLIEDNADVRRYVSEQLQGENQLIEADNGKKGLQKAFETIPDIIISDVMMPFMDGIELCKKLKADERTSHIPVILLTAKANESSRLEGLKTGADDYLTKPFSAAEIRVRIKNLIEQRKKLRKYFSREVMLQPKAIFITSIDEKFLQRAVAIVEKHMADPEFNVEAFGREIGMSRAQLYRKLHALTDQSPSEFIKTIRIKRAEALLLQQYGNIGDVAYAVGFNEPSYFTKCFREVFGQSPSEYMERHSTRI